MPLKQNVALPGNSVGQRFTPSTQYHLASHPKKGRYSWRTHYPLIHLCSCMRNPKGMDTCEGSLALSLQLALAARHHNSKLSIYSMKTSTMYHCWPVLYIRAHHLLVMHLESELNKQKISGVGKGILLELCLHTGRINWDALYLNHYSLKSIDKAHLVHSQSTVVPWST